jgi:hypothetical protein
MSFDISKKQDMDVVHTNNIYYDYYDTPVYYNQFEKNVNSAGYIKILYKNTETIDRPNLTFFPELKTYHIKHLYIVKKTHNIPTSKEFDGELIIEHDSNTNHTGSLFVCIPLKTRRIDPSVTESDYMDPLNPSVSRYPSTFGLNRTTATDIDRIIEHAESPSRHSTMDPIQLNKYIRSGQRSLVYSDKSNTTIFFTEPILVSSDFSQFKENIELFPLPKGSPEKRWMMYLQTHSLSNVYNVDSKRLSLIEKSKNHVFQEGFQEGLGDALVDCVPIEIEGIHHDHGIFYFIYWYFDDNFCNFTDYIQKRNHQDFFK